MNKVFSMKVTAHGLLILWLLIAFLFAALPTYVPDEGWFLIEVFASGQRALSNDSWKEILFHDNSFGYGGIWWGFYTAITLFLNFFLDFLTSEQAFLFTASDAVEVRNRLFDFANPAMMAPMIVMRWVSLIFFGLFGAALIKNAKSPQAGLIAVTLLLLAPIAWWSGKLASPELLSGALYGLAIISWFFRRRVGESIVLATLAIGIKLTVMPAYLALIISILWSERRQLTFYMFGKLAAIALLIFLFCNLWLLINPISGIQQVFAYAGMYHPVGNIWEQFNLIIFSSNGTWDGTNYGSLDYWSGSIYFLAVTVLAALITNKAFGLYFVTAILTQLAFMLTQPPHCWYWFPVIFSTFSAIGLIEKSRDLFIYFILAIISIWPLHNSFREIAYRTSHLQELTDLSTQHECILKALNSVPIGTVFDMAVIGTSPSKRAGWNSKNFVESYVAISSGAAPLNANAETISLLMVGDGTLNNLPVIKSFVDNSHGRQESCDEIHLLWF